MPGDHAIHHYQDVGMIHRPASRNVVAAFLNESREARFLLGGVANGLRYEPCPATPLFSDDLIHQLQGLGVNAS